ncbi:MAG: T9SS type A sorting domain-containing protein [Chitinophagaceae bacterium]|nr:T9SS type A sorting domain-containing protein [Chitinophagaceae bacterium]
MQVWDDNGGGLNQQWSFTQVETTAARAFAAPITEEKNLLQNEIVTQGLHISPNPAADYITINSTYLINGNVEIVSTIGQVVLTRHFRSKQTFQVIDISGLPKGIYLLKVSNKAGTKVTRLIRQ